MHQGLVDFGKQIGKLKILARKGWVSWVGVHKPESVADHSFRSAILVMCLSDLEGLDSDKLLRMALLHDLHEAIIGDLDYFDKKQLGEIEVKRKEKLAIREVLAALPDSLRQRYISIMDEYSCQQTKEAKLVRQVDLVELAMQAIEYEREGYSKTKLSAFWDNIENNLSNDNLKEIFKILKKERE